MRSILKFTIFLHIFIFSADAEEASVEHVGPPSWFIDRDDQTIQILIEGRGFSRGSRASIRPGPARVIQVEPGQDGKALFVDALIPKNARPATLELAIETDRRTLRVPWKLLAKPERTFESFGPDDAIMLVMPDRFADGDPKNNRPPGEEEMLDRADVHAYHGGDFRGLTQRLPYLADLGVTAIWLTPIYRASSKKFVSQAQGRTRRFADFHGYSPVDFYDVNAHFGTLEDFDALTAEAHRLGLKVIQDQVLGFVGPHHRWVERPPTANWFHGSPDRPPLETFRFDLLADPHAREEDRRGVTDGWFFGILPDLNMRDRRVRRYAIEQSIWWTVLHKIDGVRLDTYPMVDRSFWRDWSKEMETRIPGLRSVGEAMTFDPALLSFFQGGRAGWDGIDPGVHSVFDFPLNAAIVEVFSGKSPISKLAKVLGQDFLYVHPERLVTLLDNHDLKRLASVPGASLDRQRLAVLFLLTTRGIPQFTWGNELGMPGHMDDRRDFPGGFPGDPRDAFRPEGRSAREEVLFQTFKNLLKLRRVHPELRRGSLTDLHVSDGDYVYLRQWRDRRIVVAFQWGDQPIRVRLDSARGVERLYGNLAGKVENGDLVCDGPRESAAIFQVVDSAD